PEQSLFGWVASYYEANKVLFDPEATDPVSYPSLWLICVKVQRAEESPAWAVYSMTSRDIPGWPETLYGAIPGPTPDSVAQGLIAAGHTVSLYRYDNLQTAFTATHTQVFPEA
ncbi:hypothetical protein, partial [Planotetraspora phitsanulokensis]